jgi:hypothetical protein
MTNMKSCRHCGHSLKGRTDKKFCNDYCRNGFHNAENAGKSEQIKTINRILYKNRKILESWLIGSTILIRVNRKELTEAGFSFNYFTHIQNHQGSAYRYCYDLGFLPLNEKECLLWRDQG